jgi:predicted transcriptional regulator
MKLQVLVNDDLVKRIDKLADYIGTSRSSLCATMIVKALPEWEQVYQEHEKLIEEETNEQLKIEDF